MGEPIARMGGASVICGEGSRKLDGAGRLSVSRVGSAQQGRTVEKAVGGRSEARGSNMEMELELEKAAARGLEL